MFDFMQRRSVRTHASQLWKFIICGGIGFTLDLASLSVFIYALNVDPRIAVVLSSLVGAAFVFVANKFFTFRNREAKYGSQALKFIVVYGVSIISNAIISNVLIYVGMHPILAKIVAIGVGAMWNYALSHGFVFKKNEPVEAVIV